ncbi:hypothetical protein [uncultured Duncaniella sp.]|uniref:hypothetical protein n=1 Tax=uncultured Duncaniella sp. TaxID=2768039 RepID=UPI00259C8901|nr:hypothetical protein [uncultured Duncaniella sp.]
MAIKLSANNFSNFGIASVVVTGAMSVFIHFYPFLPRQINAHETSKGCRTTAFEKSF